MSVHSFIENVVDVEENYLEETNQTSIKSVIFVSVLSFAKVNYGKIGNIHNVIEK